MSFFSGNRPRPGPIQENPPCSELRHRVAVSCRRVLDSSIRKINQENARIRLLNVPRDVEPDRLVCVSSPQTAATVGELRIDRIKDRPSFARVRCSLTAPVEVEFECTRGLRHVANANHSINQDVVMFIPPESVFPFEVTSTCQIQATGGTFEANNTLCGNLCTTAILRVISETDLFIPAFGVATAPPAVGFQENACRDFFDLPLFPTGR